VLLRRNKLYCFLQTVTQSPAQQAAQSMVPDSNFLIDDNFSDINAADAAVDDIVVPPNADPAPADPPAPTVPSGTIVVPADSHPTTDSCVSYANQAPRMILPINGAAAAGAGGGGDGDSLPTSDDANDDEGDN
jgi:hypothetical protein